jgi:hypothetical protein
MKFNLILLAAVGFLANTVSAGIATNSPYDKITWTGGNTEVVTWAEDGKTPKLTDPALSKVTIQLMTGNVKQIVVDTISKSVAGTAKSVQYKVPKTVGPPGNFYFIKYSAGTYTAFSGRFTIQGVNGTIPGFDPNAPLSDPISTTPSSNSTSDSSSSSNTDNSSSSSSSSSISTDSISTSIAGPSSTPTSKSANSSKPNSSDASPLVFLSTLTLAPLALGVVAIMMTFV